LPTMKRKRRHLTAEFKARVALEALKGEKTAAEIARENEIAPAQISEWKKQLEDRLGEVFQSKGERSKELQAQERKEARLERKIGQLVIEKDFLLKKCEQLGIDLVEEYAVYMYGDLFFSWCRDQLEWGIVQL